MPLIPIITLSPSSCTLRRVDQIIFNYKIIKPNNIQLFRDDGGLLPDAYLHLVRKKAAISDHIKGPLVAAFRSPLMKALDRSVETLGL